MAANYCINRNHPKFKALAKELNVSEAQLELWAYKFNQQEGDAQAFLSDAAKQYYQERINGKPFIASMETYQKWTESYSTPQVFTSLQEASKAVNQAVQLFGNRDAVRVYETNDGKFEVRVATPYSTKDDTIYYNKQYDLITKLKNLIWEETTATRKEEHGVVYTRNNTIYLTKGDYFKDSAIKGHDGKNVITEEVKNWIERNVARLGINPEAVKLSTDGNIIKIELNDALPKDKRQLSTTTSFDTTLDFLESKIAGLSHQVIEDNTRNRKKYGYNPSANAFFHNGTVYLIKGRFNETMAIEECLHPLVNAIKEVNEELFNSLFVEASNDFKGLFEEIKQVYNKEDWEKELVTQVLSRYTSEEFKTAKERSKWEKLVDKFFDAIAELFGIIQIDRIKPTTTFAELAQIINSESGKFSINLTGKEYNLSTEVVAETKEQQIQQFIEHNQQFYNQLKTIQDSGKLSSTEVRQTAASVAYAVSDLITDVQQGKIDINSIVEGKTTKKDISEMSRAEILSFIGVDNAFNYVRDTHFLNLSEIEGRRNKNAASIIYTNFEAIKELSSEEFVNVEGFGFTKDVLDRTEVSEGMNITIDDFNNEEDASAVLEREGDLQEHWQVNFRTVDVLGSMSQLVRQALLQCYKIDADGNVIKNRFNIAERVSAREATSQILRWTQGAVDMNSMIALLNAKAEQNPWVKQIIQRLTDEGKTKEEYGADTDFRSQFYSVFSKHFQAYSTVIKDKDGNFYSNVINEHPALTDIVNQLQVLASMNKVSMFTTEGVNEKRLATLQAFIKELTVKNKREFDALSEEEADDLRDSIYGAIAELTGNSESSQVLISDEQIKSAWTWDNYKQVKDALGYIATTLQSNLKNPNFEPFEFKGGIKGNLMKVISPFIADLEDTAVSSFHDGDKTYQSYVTPSYLTKFMQKMKLTGEEFAKFIQDEFGQYDWFKDQTTGEWLNPWIKDIVEKGEKGFKVGNISYKDLLAHKVELSFNGRNYMRDMSPAEYTISVLAEFFTSAAETKDPIVPAWYRVPILSNKPSAEYIRFTRYADLNTYKESVLNDLMKVFNQELMRIKTVKARNEKYKKGSLEYIKNYDKNGSVFNFLPYLNESSNEVFNSLVERITNGEELSIEEVAKLNKEATKEIRQHLDNRTKEILNKWEKDGIMEAAKSIKGINNNNVRALLENFIWNDNLACMMIEQLFVTDIALYKNTEDLQKRLAQIHAPGVRGDINAVDYNGNKVSDGKYRTILLTDFDDFKSNIIENLREVFERRLEHLTGTNRTAAEATYNAILKQFEEINVADAQGYSSPTSRRKKDFIMGLWSKEKEALYQKLINGKYTDADLRKLMDITNASEPEKPFVYSQISKPSGVDTGMQNLKLGVQYKNSEYLLIMADAILQNERTGRPNLLRSVYEFMEESAKRNPGRGIDTIQFESTSKALVQGALNIKQFQYTEGGETSAKEYLYENVYDMEYGYNPVTVHEVNFEDWCLQQQVPNHFYEHTQAHGSQIRMITPSDLMTEYNGQPVTYNVYGKEYSAQEFRQEYENTIAANIQESIDGLTEELGLNAASTKERNVAIAKILQREIKSSPRYGTDLLKACTLDNNGEFIIPLSDPIQSKRIEQLLNSIIKNRVNKQEIAGGPVVQVSNFGTSRELNIVFKDKKGGLLKTRSEFKGTDEEYKNYIANNQGGIAYYEIFAPRFEGIEVFEDKYGNIDIEAIKKANPELLDMICYRIPTEDKYSCAPCKIVGFLPKIAGAGIMMPNDITLLTGSDFDVDKMYCMRKEFIIKKDKKGITVTSYGENTRQGRNNKIVEMTRSVLTHESTVDKIMNPGGFEPQRKMGYMVQAYKSGHTNWEALDKMKISDLKDLSYKSSDLGFIDTQVQFYKQNSAAGSILAIFAVAKVAHATLEGNGYRLVLDNDEFQGGIGLLHPLRIGGYTVGSEGDMTVEIDPTYNMDGQLIGKELGNLVASAADAVKDPVLNLMNINKETVNVLNTLIRVGVPFQTAALLLSQQVITDVVQEYYKRALTENITLQKVIEEKLNDVNLGTAINEDISKDALIKGLSDASNAKHNGQVLYAVSKVFAMSNALRGINFATRFNSISSAVGPLVIDNIIKEDKSSDSNFNQLVDKSGNKVVMTDILQAHPILSKFRDTLYVASTLFKEMPEYSISFLDAITNSATNGSVPQGFVNRILRNRKLLGKYSDFFKSYMLVASGVIDTNELDYFINKFPAELAEAKANGTYSDNALIETLRLAKDKEGALYIKVPNGLLNDQTLKEDMSAAWIDLLQTNRDMAIKLFKYCFFRGGLGFTPKTFMSLVPVEIKLAVEGYVDTFKDIDRTFYRYSQGVFGLADQFVQNNWKDNSLVPENNLTDSKTKSSLYYITEDNTLVVDKDKMSLPYFKMKDNEGKYTIYKLLDSGEDNNFYIPLQTLGGNNDYLEIHKGSHFDYERLHKEVAKTEVIDDSQYRELEPVDEDPASTRQSQESVEQKRAEDAVKALGLVTEGIENTSGIRQSALEAVNNKVQVSQEDVQKTIEDKKIC